MDDKNDGSECGICHKPHPIGSGHIMGFEGVVWVPERKRWEHFSCHDRYTEEQA